MANPKDQKPTLAERVKRLNTLYFNGRGWTTHTARKERRDQFGDIIHEDQKYFARKLPYTRGIELTSASMEKLIECLFWDNEPLERRTAEIVREQEAERMEREGYYSDLVAEALLPETVRNQLRQNVDDE